MAINRTSMFPSSTGTTEIGDYIAMPDVGQTYTKISGVKLQRTGVVGLAASYPIAATIDHLKCTGSASTQATGLGSTYTDIATDGAGRWVMAYANNTNVLVSTDNGVTWATVAHSAGGTITSVCYSSALGLFISAGNSTTQFYTSSVAAASVASAWTARTGTAITGGLADSSIVRASANEVVMFCGNASTGGASKSTNGTSWTAANFAASPNGAISSFIGSLVNYGGSIWVASGSNQSQMQRSTDGGATWATITNGITEAGIKQGAYSSGLGLSVNFTGSGNLWTSTTGATGTWTNRGNPFGAFVANNVVWDGTRFITSLRRIAGSTYDPAYAYSTDGLTWNIRGFLNKSWADGIAYRISSDGTNLVFAPIYGSVSGAVYGTFSANTYIGIPYRVGVQSSSSSVVGDVYYVRVQ